MPVPPPRWCRVPLVAAVLLAAGCGDPPSAAPPAGAQLSDALELTHGPPFVSGRVARLPQPDDDWGYLVLGEPQPNGDPHGAFFHLGRARLLWESGAPAPASALVVGRRATVYAEPDAPVLLSLPPRIAASVIVLAEH